MNVKFFTGAPHCDSLAVQDGSLDEFVPEIKRFLNGNQAGHNGSTLSASAPQSSIDKWPAWRSLGTIHAVNGHVDGEMTGLRARNEPTNGHVNINHASAAADYRSSPDDAEDQYHEHSFAIWETAELTVSQSAPVDTSFNDTSLSFTSESTSLLLDDSFTSQPSTQLNANSTTFDLPRDITPIAHLPSASYLHRLYPQTPTYNLLVGIISNPGPRTVTLRQLDRRTGQPRQMEIVELLVGDHSRAPFTVTFWLQPTDGDAGVGIRPAEAVLRAKLTALRPRMVVCFTNLAMGDYKSKVFGQGLGRRGGSAGTGVILLKRLDLGDARVRRVTEWVRDFLVGDVGGTIANERGRAERVKPAGGRVMEELPPDTQ